MGRRMVSDPLETLVNPMPSIAGTGWNTYANDLVGRMGIAAATVNGILYAIDGNNGSGSTYDLSNNNGYNPSTNQWTAYAADSFGVRAFPVAMALSGIIYVADGYGTSATNANTGYNPSTNAWTAYASSTTAESEECAATWGGLGYVFDGLYANTTKGYNPSTNAWTNYKPDTTTRHDSSADSNGNTIYVACGQTSTAYQNLLEGYAPSTNAWTTYTSDITQARVHPTSATSNGTVYVANGSDAVGVQTVVTGYSAVSNAWTQYPGTRYGKSQSACVVINGTLYIVDGASANTSYSTELTGWDTHQQYQFMFSDQGPGVEFIVSGFPSGTQVTVQKGASTILNTSSVTSVRQVMDGGTYTVTLSIASHDLTAVTAQLWRPPHR